MHADALVVRGLLGLAIFATPLQMGSAQGETGKPTPGGRPPAPVARQLPDGRIEVLWPAVEGAVKYQLSRSVPPTPETVLSPPNPADTVYFDSDVQAGKTYYYVVAPVDQSGHRGIKKGTVPVKASISATPGDSSAGLRANEQGPAQDTTASGGGVVSAPSTSECTTEAPYRTCTSGLYQLLPAEWGKNGTALCPGGYIAVGGGFEGDLTTALVQQSRPLIGGAKTRAGWTVVVVRILPNVSSDMVQRLAEVFRSSIPVKFRVYVVCAPAAGS